MRDNCCYREPAMLGEDRVSANVPSSVYTRINDPDDTTTEDPFDAENERHYGFSQDTPCVTNVVVLPSYNKWNCFSIRDRKTVNVIRSRDNMNTTTSVSPTSTLETKKLFSEKVTDYPGQASRSSRNDSTSNGSANRRLTLREKLDKQRSQRENNDNAAKEPQSLTRSTTSSSSAANYHSSTFRGEPHDARNDGDIEKSTRRLTKAISLGSAATPPTNYHRPASRSQSNSSITEEKTLFGFKVMKGLPSSPLSPNNNRSARHGTASSPRQPSRTISNSTSNRFRDKTGNALFYTPKNNRVTDTTSKSEKPTEPDAGDSLKNKEDSFGSSTKIELKAGRSSEDVDTKSSDKVEKDKNSSNVVTTTVMNVGARGRRSIHVKESTRVGEKSENRRESLETKCDGKTSDENRDNESFKVSKEIEVKNEEGKTEKLLIRAESLREGKTRLEEFREKQKRGKLTRSLTNPDFQQTENNAVAKGKNISESLAEIRERIRERRRKRDHVLKKSQSVPEVEGLPEQQGEKESEKFSDDAKDRIRERRRKRDHVLKKSQSVPELDAPPEQQGEKESEKFSDDAKDNLEKSKKVEHSGGEEKPSLNESECPQNGENRRMNKDANEHGLRTVEQRYDDVKEKENEKIIGAKAEEEKVEETRDDEVKAVDTKVQADKDGQRKSDLVIPQGKKIEPGEILSNKGDETRKTKAETSMNSIAASSSEQSKSEVKKPTKRERRKHERYQRSKTMSAIMYNEISLEARREMQHKGADAKSGGKDGESFAILSVSEIKKRFAEANSGGNSKTSELGLFYSGKTPASEKSSGINSLSSRSKTSEKSSAKDDSATNTAKTSRTRSRRNAPRRHTLAIGTTLSDQVNVVEHVKITNANSTKSTDAMRADKNENTKARDKMSVARRHTLPSYTTEISIQCKDAHSSVNCEKKDVSESGRRLPVRRHTFCSETTLMVSRQNPAKFTESVETIREKFSKGGAPVFNLASSAKSENDVDRNEQNRRRNGDSSVRRIIEEAKNLKDAQKGSGSSLTRRHTIANGHARKLSGKDEDERQEFLDKFLAKDEEVHTSSNSKEMEITQDFGSNTGDGGKKSTHTKNKKEEKISVSKLKKLFLGQPSNTERKTKRREQRAKTIAGGISEDIMKELAISSRSNNVLSNKYVVKPDLYVTDTTQEEATERKPERRRRTSDLNPDNYLSSEPLLSKQTGTDSVFGNKEDSQDNAQSEDTSSKVGKPAQSNEPVITSARRRSISDSDMKIPGNISLGDETTSEGRVDVVDLRTPTETDLSVLNAARRRSGSESDMNNVCNVSRKDQCLDEYLSTAIKTLTDSPKPQRSSPRNSAQKGKFTASQSFDQSDEGQETKTHLDVVKTSLSMHSWSTSDLDKIIHGGNGMSSSTSQVDVSSMDFDEISSSTTRLHSLTENRTKARPKRTSSKSLNPLKSLMERTDVRSHTEEPEDENKPASGFEKAKKRSSPRKKRSQVEPWRRHTLDPVALAALAGREDFSRVSLRKTKGPGNEKDEYTGSLPVMLIQIKGRRQVQTRLVEPSLSSLNTGDCFLLVTPKELFCWIGQDANTIEKAKAVEISSKIQKRGDMDCKTGDVLYIDEAKQGNSLAYRKFCKILEGDTDFPIEDAKMCPDDEFYEREVISTNKVYKLQEGDPPHLMAITEMCGYMPRICVLNTKEVFVFDFGSELYVWTGQQSMSKKRKVAFHLAEMLYKQQFDCDGVISPIDPRRAMQTPRSSQPLYRNAEGKECGRPKWTLFAKLHEKAETLLFREKFFDWPDPTKIIKMKGHVSSGEMPERPRPVELKPCDPMEMQKPASDLEPAILEATNLGRGLGTPNVEINGEVKEGDMVTTLGMKVWLVTQNKHFDLPKTSEGHFHSGHGYVIRWVYFVAKNRIVRDRRGRVRPMTGRQRCAYFFWQGNECSVNEKGAAAIMAVELDEEHGPQIRVVEGKEPPHFLKLFDGAMVIHSGKRTRAGDELDDFSDNSTVRMYCIRNEDVSEGCLVQVKRSASSLRSRSSFVVVDSEQGTVFVWHGCKTNEYHRASAEKAANFIQERRPMEMYLTEESLVTVTVVEEGQESDLFWLTVSGKKKNYLSLLNDTSNYDFCPRLFHMTSATGQFTSTEILSPSRYPDRTCPFPVVQDDLYSASQPASFLLDVGNEVYVWEGWMPSEITKDKRGSAKRRWDEERKLTLQTALSYVEEAKERITKGAHVVQAGFEPPSFTTHFPFWNRRQDIAELQRKEGKNDYEKKTVEYALDTLTKKFYSLQQLTSDNPPDGVDLSKLETYLSDDEFEKIFEMSRDLFGQLPGWKQDILKKAFGLF